MTKLYTITVATDFVFASESEDIDVVLQEFEDALRTNYGMRDELEEGDVSGCPMGHLPARYSLAERPWGTDSSLTILDHINQGAAPAYAKRLEMLNRLRKQEDKS